MSKGYELVRENGKIIDVKINGKPAKRSYVNALKKAQNTSYWLEYNESGYVQNPLGFGGAECNPLERTIAEWCKRWYYGDYAYNPRNTQVNNTTFDNMRYFLSELNSNAYMSILD